MFCTKCGNPIIPGDKFCRKCGTPAPLINEPLEEKRTDSAPSFEAPSYEPKKPGKPIPKFWIPIAIAVVFLALLAVGLFVVLPAFRNAKTDVPQVQNTEDAVVDVVQTTQRITVAPSGSGYSLTLEELENDVWVSRFSCSAKISPAGLTATKTEGDSKTPSGTFEILFCTGISKPNTNLAFVGLSPGDVWVDDAKSAYYNTLQKGTLATKDWNSAEDFYSYFNTGRNNAAIFFDYNGDGQTMGSATSGWGSVVFLFGRKNYATDSPKSGDIYISTQDMTTLLSYLDSSKNPVITIK